MTSFIVISKDKKKREEHIKIFCETHEIDTFDITTITTENTVKNTQSIGIEDIKNMQKKIFFKPIKSKTKTVILEDAHLLTPEAQNALLKVLEEPPEHTLIVLATESREPLLPTILSRCQIIELGEVAFALSEKEQTSYTEFLEKLQTWEIGERLKKAEQLAKDKDKTLIWLEKLIIILRKKMLEQPETDYYFNLLKPLQRLHTILKTTNVNPRFALENTFLSLQN